MRVQQTWFQLASIKIGIVICLPSVLAGHILYAQGGLCNAVLGLIIGGIFCFLLSIFSMEICSRYPQVIMNISKLYLGDRGRMICSLAFATSCLGWFAIQLDLMGQALNEFTFQSPTGFIFSTLVLGMLIVIVGARGIRSIDIFARLTLPLMAALIIGCCFNLFFATPPSIEVNSGQFLTSGIVLIVAGKLTGIIDIPTYYRFARSKKDAYVSSFLSYIVAIPFVGSLGVVLAIFEPKLTFIQALTKSGGGVWGFLAVFFLIIAGWTTNNGNLYTSAMALQPLFHKVKEESILVTVGVLGSVLACLGLSKDLPTVLSAMGILVGSTGALVWARFLLTKFQVVEDHPLQQKVNQCVIVFASLVGVLSFFKILTLSTFAYVDAMLTSFIFSIIANSVVNPLKKRYHIPLKG